jgi:hypothetical protein
LFIFIVLRWGNSDLPSSGSELKNEKIIHDKTSGGNEKEN